MRRWKTTIKTVVSGFSLPVASYSYPARKKSLILRLNFWSCSYGEQPLLWPLLRKKTDTTFLKFHIHLEENLARSFQNVFDKCSRVFKSCILKRLNFSCKSPHFRVPYYVNALTLDQKSVTLKDTFIELSFIMYHSHRETASEIKMKINLEPGNETRKCIRGDLGTRVSLG